MGRFLEEVELELSLPVVGASGKHWAYPASLGVPRACPE